MNEKIGIQNLQAALIEKNGLSNKEAETFVKEFFQLIVEALENEKYVKIKGLGTFKLIDVDSRESVDVNTGERIEIKSHTKISFTPDNTLRDVINRPFAHFETVILNANALLDNTSVENEEEDSQDTAEDLQPNETEGEKQTATGEASKELPSSTAHTSITEEQEVQPVDKQINNEYSAAEVQKLQTETQEFINVQQTEQDSTVSQTLEMNQESGQTEENAVQNHTLSATISETNVRTESLESEESGMNHAENEGENTETKAKTEIEYTKTDDIHSTERKATAKYKIFITIITIIIAICLGCIAYLYWPVTEQGYSDESIPTNQIEDKTTNDSPSPLKTNVTADTLHTSDTVEKAPVSSQQPTSENSENQVKTSVSVTQVTTSRNEPVQKKKTTTFTPDSVGYEIVGTETSYTIKDGETLTKISLRFWGTKSLWPYLVKHNSDVIKNPDNVPYGTVIKIPKLKKK